MGSVAKCDAGGSNPEAAERGRSYPLTPARPRKRANGDSAVARSYGLEPSGGRGGGASATSALASAAGWRRRAAWASRCAM